MKLARLARRFSSSSLSSLSAPGQQSVLRKEHSFAQKEVSVFAVLSGDSNPIHTDPSAAQSAGFSACVVHGMLCASLCSSLISSRFPGAFYESKTLRFKEPALVGDCIEAEVKILSTVPATGGLSVELSMQCCKKESNVLVLEGSSSLIVPVKESNVVWVDAPPGKTTTTI